LLKNPVPLFCFGEFPARLTQQNAPKSPEANRRRNYSRRPSDKKKNIFPLTKVLFCGILSNIT
jgi:hypothetical protein